MKKIAVSLLIGLSLAAVPVVGSASTTPWYARPTHNCVAHAPWWLRTIHCHRPQKPRASYLTISPNPASSPAPHVIPWYARPVR